jgi:hypothetical protein
MNRIHDEGSKDHTDKGETHQNINHKHPLGSSELAWPGTVESRAISVKVLHPHADKE